MRRPSRPGLPLLCALCACMPLAAQNLESIGKEKPFSVSGGLSLNQIFYVSTGGRSARDPYRYFASGNINFSLYGWSVPLSFSVSNHDAAFHQPFNRYALHPKWKWITVHAGYTSVSFSPYTVNGHIFLGGAVDLAPEGNWKVSALYGRFSKAVRGDTLNGAAAPSFQRTGYGIKTSFANRGNFADLILFHARDDERSLRRAPASPGISPEENFVLSVAGGKTFFNRFTIKAEVASSALTTDTRSAEADAHGLAGKIGVLFQPRLASSYYEAIKTSCDLQLHRWLLGIGWERVDPGYRTLGAYYFTNDLESATLHGSAVFLHGRMNVAGRGGIQQDNVDKTKISTMRRLVGSLTINYTAGTRFNLSGAWSSFQTYTRLRSRFEMLNPLAAEVDADSLNFTQISQNASVSATWSLGGETGKSENVSINLTWQDAADEHGAGAARSATAFYNFAGAYTLSLVPGNTTFSFALNGSLDVSAFMKAKTWGPHVTLIKSFFNRKFRTTLSSSYNMTHNEELSQNVINLRMNGMVTVKEKHHLTLAALWVSRGRMRKTQDRSPVREMTATIGYRYSFGGSTKNTP